MVLHRHNVWQTGRQFGSCQRLLAIWRLQETHRDPLGHQPSDAIVERGVVAVYTLNELNSIQDLSLVEQYQ